MPRLPARDKIQIVEEVVKGKCSVCETCKKYGISKPTFYKWLRIYKQSRKNRLSTFENKNPRNPRYLTAKQQFGILRLVHKEPELSCSEISKKLSLGRHAVWNFLVKKALNSSSLRGDFATKPFWKRETPERRLAMMELAESGWRAQDICRHFNVSKVTFNKWKKRYLYDTNIKEILLNDRYASGAQHPKTTNNKVAGEVLDAALANPQYSINKLHREFQGVIGHHGIYNVLRRNGLNTYEARLARARETSRPKVQVAPLYQPQMPLYRLRMLLSPFVTVPKLLSLLIRSPILLVFILLVSLYVYKIFSAVISSPTGFLVGTFFAAVSLTFGTFFFIYSMKYYITILMVLKLASSSAKAAEDKQNGRVNPLLINLEKVELTSHPFVSIHVALYNETRVVERLIRACTSQKWENFELRTANYELIIADDSNDETTEIAKQVLLSEGWTEQDSGQWIVDSGELAASSKFKVQSSKLEEDNDDLEYFVFNKPNAQTVKLIHRFSRAGFKGGALQKALENTDSRAEYIAVFDADFVPYPDTIEQFIKSFQETCGGLEKVSESNVAAVQGYQWHVLNKSQTWVTRGVRTEYAGRYVIERSGAEIY